MATKHLHRIDPNYIKEVSDDEVETPLPDVSSFMNITPIVDARDGPSCPLPTHAVPELLPANQGDIRAADTTQLLPDPSLGHPWQWSVVGNVDHASTTIPTQPKSMPIDFHSLGPIYLFYEVSKNRQQLDVMKIPNAILQMAYLKLFIPLSMLTSSSLPKIQANNGLKYHKIPFGFRSTQIQYRIRVLHTEHYIL